jgi:hypothetical protein
VKHFLPFLFCLFFLCSFSQKSAKNIGLSHCPADKDTVQQSLNVKHNGNEPGPKKGDAVPPFKLYGLNNDSLDIAQELKKGKPVFLINGSYTCHFFRRTLAFFDSLAVNHKEIGFFIIYTIEAHPGFPYTCPYTDETTALKYNYEEKVDVAQHKTYADRKEAARLMIKNTVTKIPVYLDGPLNPWIKAYGSMPNIAYLITTDGKIKFKYLNYKSQQKEIIRDFNSLK